MLIKFPDLELTALATTKRSHKIGLDLQKEYQINKLYDNNADLFNDPDVDTVYVAVPNSLHFSISKEALEAGKNVICEKPFVATVDEARKLKAIADQKKLIIIEAITNIYLENFKFIEENLDKIAPIHVVNLNYTQYSSRYDAFLAGDIQPAFDPKKDGGALMDLEFTICILLSSYLVSQNLSIISLQCRKISTPQASCTSVILTNKLVQSPLKTVFHLMSALLKVKKVHLLFMVILMKYLKSECN